MILRPQLRTAFWLLLFLLFAGQCSVVFAQASLEIELMVDVDGGATVPPGILVTSQPAGFSCQPSASPCLASFPVGSTVSLTYQTGAQTQFAGWSGLCATSLQPTCVFTVPSPKEGAVSPIVATFIAAPVALSPVVTVSPATVTLTPCAPGKVILAATVSASGCNGECEISSGNGEIAGIVPYVYGKAGSVLVSFCGLPGQQISVYASTDIFTSTSAYAAVSQIVPLTFAGLTCASGLQPSSGATLVDPVPTLLNALSTGNAAMLGDPNQGRVVQGVAADGVARVIVRIPACAVGDQVNVSIINDANSPSQSVDEDGGVASLEDPSNFKSTASAQAVMMVNGQPMAIFVYRAPVDFPRPSGSTNANAPFDASKRSRPIDLQVNIPAVANPIDALVTVVRPPVILVHGFNSKASAWSTFTPMLNDQNLFTIDPVNYGTPFPYTTLEGTFEPPIPSGAGQLLKSHFGLKYNACPVFSQIEKFIVNYRTRDPMLPVASVAADVIAHSMGGLLIKYGSQQSYFKTGANFHAGSVHKLITLGTPYYGTPQAIIQLAPTSACSRNLAASHGTFSIQSFTFNSGAQIIGAVSDLEGAGDGSHLSDVLQVVNSLNARALPTAVIAGDLGAYLANLNDFNALDIIYARCGPTSQIDAQGLLGGSILLDVPGFATSINGLIVHRERDGDDILPYSTTGIVGYLIPDSFAFYLTKPRFLTQFDPTITSDSPQSGMLPLDSDGSVPVSSATGGYAVTTTKIDHLHSIGWQELIRTLYIGDLTQHLQNSQVVANLAEQFLNTNARDPTFNRQ